MSEVPGDFSLGPWQLGLDQGALSVAQEKAEEGTTFSLFVEAGVGSRPAEAPRATTVPCLCLLPRRSAESSGLVWLPRPCLVSQGDNDREEGGVRRAGWELPSGKPSFESTFFSKPQTRLPKRRLTHGLRLRSF